MLHYLYGQWRIIYLSNVGDRERIKDTQSIIHSSCTSPLRPAQHFEPLRDDNNGEHGKDNNDGKYGQDENEYHTYIKSISWDHAEC